MVTSSPFNYAAHWPVCLTAMSVLQICHDDDYVIVSCTLSIDTYALMHVISHIHATYRVEYIGEYSDENTHAHKFNSTIIPDNLLLMVKIYREIADTDYTAPNTVATCASAPNALT